MSTTLFSYEGRLYVRPSARGVVSADSEGMEHIEDVLAEALNTDEGTTPCVHLTIEPMEDEA